MYPFFEQSLKILAFAWAVNRSVNRIRGRERDYSLNVSLFEYFGTRLRRSLHASNLIWERLGKLSAELFFPVGEIRCKIRIDPQIGFAKKGRKILARRGVAVKFKSTWLYSRTTFKYRPTKQRSAEKLELKFK